MGWNWIELNAGCLKQQTALDLLESENGNYNRKIVLNVNEWNSEQKQVFVFYNAYCWIVVSSAWRANQSSQIVVETSVCMCVCAHV